MCLFLRLLPVAAFGKRRIPITGTEDPRPGPGGPGHGHWQCGAGHSTGHLDSDSDPPGRPAGRRLTGTLTSSSMDFRLGLERRIGVITPNLPVKVRVYKEPGQWDSDTGLCVGHSTPSLRLPSESSVLFSAMLIGGSRY